MTVDLQIVNPLSYQGWDTLVLTSANYSVFHSANWARVLQETYGFTPCYVIGIHDRSLRFCLPLMEVRGWLGKKRGVSLPFSDYCEPLVLNGVHVSSIFSSIIDYAKDVGWDSIELRGGKDLFPTAIPATQYYGHILRLSKDEKDAFRRLRGSTQRNIRKAIREGVEVKIEISSAAIEEYYRLHCRTRKAHGLPPQPFRLFEKVHHYLIGRGQGFVALANYKKRNIAGAVFLLGDKKALFKYGASEKTHLSLRPNDLIMWEAIRRFVLMGCTILSFGRTDLDHQGLRQFKNGWGTEENLINYYRYNIRSNAFIRSSNPRPALYNHIFRIMPVGLLKLVGSCLYKHVAS